MFLINLNAEIVACVLFLRFDIFYDNLNVKENVFFLSAS